MILKVESSFVRKLNYTGRTTGLKIPDELAAKDVAELDKLVNG